MTRSGLIDGHLGMFEQTRSPALRKALRPKWSKGMLVGATALIGIDSMVGA